MCEQAAYAAKMPDDDLEKLISEAKHLAESRQWALVAFLLGLAGTEAAKLAEKPMHEPATPPERPGFFSRRKPIRKS